MRVSAKSVAIVSSIVAALAVAFLVGVYVSSSNQRADRFASFEGAVARADSASSNEFFAMATGAMDEDVEGLFTLDYLSGELQCVVLNRRNGKFTGVFKANVAADLGIAQNTKYIMTTGRLNVPGQGSNSVVYVMDTTSGNFAAYRVPWRRDYASSGRPQGGNLALMDVGKARNAPIRGQ